MANAPTIRCPNCQHAIALAGAKAGHYRPTCPTCAEKFDLLIPNDPSEPPRATTLRAESAKPQATLAKPQAAASATVAPSKGESAAVDRTQFFIADPPRLAYDDLHGRLGGYEIVRKLGQGGMGSVYLARQLSLDRDVALKTLSPTLAGDPAFVARFTREAYAAAQLNHPNVVQIHDIGQDRGTSFFSMELVEGSTLAGVVEREGRLDPLTAVNYTLQAARGLRFAHEHGLIHRDVKPENLLLGETGIVKVADLGLVKRSGMTDAAPAGPSSAGAASANATQLNTSMGTPAYMAPEQARDAAKVDARADIYSLGCTLYDLVTGRPPFSGTSALEVITKHQTQAITPPEKIVANLPKRLSEIIRKMTAKLPEARHPSMAAIVKDLEDFLGVEHDGASGVRANTDNVKRVEVAVAQFNAAPFAQVRRNGVLAFYVACGLGFIIGLLTGSPRLAGGSVAFAVLATLAYQVTLGLKQRTVLFAKVRQLVFGASVVDWLTWVLAGAVAVALLYFFGQLWIWIGVAVLASFLGATFHFGIDSVVAVQREEPLAAVEALVREMRVKGIDEDGIRGFIAKFSGTRWEAFYEALFGYEAKMLARRLYGKGERGRDRKRHGAWRDWIIAWIDHKLDDRKAEREQRLLARLEARALEARGVAAGDASRQARASAANVVDRVQAVKEAARATAVYETLPPAEQAKRVPATLPPTAVFSDDDARVSESLEGYQRTGYFRRRFGGPFDIVLGRRVRFFLAAALLLGSGRWVQMNGVAAAFEGIRGMTEDVQHAKDAITRKIETAAAKGTVAPTSSAKRAEPIAAHGAPIQSLRVPGVPDAVCDAVGSLNGLVAGALLLLSVPLYGHLMSIVTIAGCAIAIAGPQYELPVLGPTPWWLALGVGGAVALLGMLFLRQTID